MGGHIQLSGAELKKAEQMIADLIVFLKRKNMWQTDMGIVFNGRAISSYGEKVTPERPPGIARIWFEGAMYRAMNYGIDDPKYSIYRGIEATLKKYGYYFEFLTGTDIAIYPINPSH